MSWVFGILGALLGLVFMEGSRGLFATLAGALAGALLGQVLALRRRASGLEQRLARIEAQGRRVDLPDTEGAQATAATPTPKPTPPPQAGAQPTPPATPPPAASPAVVSPAPAMASSAPPALPAATITSAASPAGPASAGPAPAAAPAGGWAPAEPADPDPLARLLGLAKAWLFEGNVPVKIGMLVLMFGVASALKYASDAGWLVLPVELRLAGIAAAAIAGLVWGLRSAVERPAFGLSLQGGAIGILLLVVFAAFRYYQVLPAMPAFVLVVVLVAGASVLAVRQNAAALAVLGFIGGYLAPVLISTGSGNHVALFSYYAVLNAAVFGIAWHRPWRALNLVGFAFTFAIGGLWGAKYYRPELFGTVEPFLVLFFLFYVGIPVLYALAGRERNGKVDGTLLFGTPLLAFPMQVALLDGDRLPLAASAVIVAAIYAGLATWAVRNPRLRALAQSTAAMGVVFATLAVPLALEAKWTAAAWALQSVGMAWLGLRQKRALTRWAGLVLLGLATIACGIAFVDGSPQDADRLLINGYAMNLALLALAGFAIAWLHDRAGGFRVLPVLLFGFGLFFWAMLGLREVEVNLDPDATAVAYAAFAALTAALAALLRKPMAWPRAGWATLAAIAVLPFLALASLSWGDWRWGGGMPHWFAMAERLWWPILAVALASLAGLRSPASRALPVAHLFVLGTLAFGAGLSLMRWSADTLGLADGWWLPALLLPLAAITALAGRRPTIGAWPLAAEFPAWRPVLLAGAGGVMALAWLTGLMQAGDSDPLPWLPAFNPLELVLLLGLVAALAGLRRVSLPAHIGGLGWGIAAVVLLTSMVLRACHHLAGLDWGPMLLAERVAQTSLTVAWCVAGLVACVIGSRRGQRPIWWFGAGLLMLVLLKLIAVDRLFIGNLTGIVSFVAVGLLFMLVGRLAPSPPRPESR